MRIAFHTAMFPSLRSRWNRGQILGFGYLAAMLRRDHPEIEIVLTHDEEELFSSGAEVAGITCVTYTYSQARRIAAEFRARGGGVVILGGPHVTALPERLDREFDFGVLGEGEATLSELMAHLKEGRPAAELTRIEGLVFWNDGERVINPRRPLTEPLDDIPHPDRELYNHDDALRRASLSLMTSRGCPYDCAFCATAKHWERLRTHSAEYVLEEIDQIVRHYRPWQIVFEDDLFIANRKRLVKIAEGILKRGYPRGLRIHVNGRANLINDEVCEILRSINCDSVFMGLESASDKTLLSLGKRGITCAVNQQAIDTLRRHRIKVVGSFILGSPGETFEDLHATYAFAQRNLEAFCRLDSGLLRLFPGTALWEEGMRLGLIDEPMTGILLEAQDVEDGWGYMTQRYPMLTQAVSRNELLGMHLAMQELCHAVRERNEHPRLVDNMGIRALAGALGRKILGKLRA